MGDLGTELQRLRAKQKQCAERAREAALRAALANAEARARHWEARYNELASMVKASLRYVPTAMGEK